METAKKVQRPLTDGHVPPPSVPAPPLWTRPRRGVGEQRALVWVWRVRAASVCVGAVWPLPRGAASETVHRLFMSMKAAQILPPNHQYLP